MKKLILLLLISAISLAQTPTRNIAGFGAGFTSNDMHSSAILEGRSTTKGFLFPRMTTTQRDAIASPASSLWIYNTTSNKYNFYNGSSWIEILSGSVPTQQQVTEAGNEIVSDDGLLKIVLNKALGGIQIYKRADIGDSFSLVNVVANGVFGALSLDGLQYTNLEPDGFSVVNPTDFDVTKYLYDRVMNHLDNSYSVPILLPTASIDGGATPQKFAIEPINVTADFDAENGAPYTANGTLTVTDPTPLASKGYVVHVIGGTATIGGVGYTAGALIYRYYNGSVWVSKDYGASITIDSTPTDGSSNAVSSNGVFDALDLKQDKVTGVSDTEIGYLDGVTSAIQTQLDARVKRVVNIITPSSALTGTTLETQITSFNFTIPANTFSSTDIMKVERMAWEKLGVLNASTCRLKLSNTNDYATASNVMILAASGGNINMSGRRTYKIAGGNLKGLMSSAANGIFNDDTLTNVAVSTLALDVTQPIYGFISLQVTNGGDSVIMNELIISK